jgi:ferredoxin
LLIGFFAWRHGRTFCNTICPTGTILGFLSKYSLFKIRFNETKCNRCGVCSMKCKAACINSKEQKIDYSRCVDCFDCLNVCNQKAMVFARAKNHASTSLSDREAIDSSKRKFLATGLLTAISIPALLAQGKEIILKGGQKIFTRKTPISPPGSKSHKNLLRKCTSCHLCVSKCPSKVLKPALMEYGLAGMMQPIMTFEKGYCNYNCTVCGDVCPTSAIVSLTKRQKHEAQVGVVVFNRDICVVVKNGFNCGACAEHCPTQAVRMVPYKGGLTIPEINEDICIGCGGCEFICPVRPYRAIFVEGNEVHQTARIENNGEDKSIKINDFGF